MPKEIGTEAPPDWRLRTDGSPKVTLTTLPTSLVQLVRSVRTARPGHRNDEDVGLHEDVGAAP